MSLSGCAEDNTDVGLQCDVESKLQTMSLSVGPEDKTAVDLQSPKYDDQRKLHFQLYAWGSRTMKNVHLESARVCNSASKTKCRCLSRIVFECHPSKDPAVGDWRRGQRRGFGELLEFLEIVLGLARLVQVYHQSKRGKQKEASGKAAMRLFLSTFTPVMGGSNYHHYDMPHFKGVLSLCNSGMRLLFYSAGKIIDPTLKKACDRDQPFAFFHRQHLDMKHHLTISAKRQREEKVKTDPRNKTFKTTWSSRNKPTISASYASRQVKAHYHCVMLRCCMAVLVKHPEKRNAAVSDKDALDEYRSGGYPQIHGSSVSSLRTYLTDCRTFLGMGLLLVADVRMTPSRSGVLMEMFGQPAYYCEAQGCFVEHHGNVNVCQVQGKALRTLLEVYHRSYDLSGRLLETKDDGLPRFVDEQSGVNSNQELQYFASVTAPGGHGMAGILRMEPNQCDTVFPELAGLRQTLYSTVLEMVGVAVAGDDVPASEYKLWDDFGVLRSQFDFELTSVQLYHLDFAREFLKMARELGHLVYLAFFPLAEEGMWLRIMPEAPVNSEGELDIAQKTQWSHFLGVVGTEATDPKLKVEGRWLWIPYGSMVVVPASLYHSGHIRTSQNGNPRGHFYVYAEKPGPQNLLEMQDELAHNEGLEENSLYGWQDYIEKTPADDPCTRIIVEHTKGDGFILANKQWRTDGLKTFCNFFYL